MSENNNYFNYLWWYTFTHQDAPPRYTAIVQDMKQRSIYRCNYCGTIIHVISDEVSEKFPQYCLWCDSIFTSVSRLIPKQSNLKDEDNADIIPEEVMSNHTFFYRLKLSICNFFNSLHKSLYIKEKKWKTET